jgi:hypothetical protein
MKSVNDIEQTAKKIRFKPNSTVNERILNSANTALENSRQSKPNLNKLKRLVWAGGLAAAFLIISSWFGSFVLYREVMDLRNELSQRDVAVVPITDDSATINFYLEEHQDLIARHASFSPTTSQPVQMRLSQHDILYYEFLDDEPELMHPGIIVRGPSYQNQIGLPEAYTISNGHTLTLSEAKEAVDFELKSPSWLHPGYKLDQIRKIEGHNTLQLLYTNGINSISLFEQSLDGQRGLRPKDFREYAVYRNKEQVGGTILAWRDDALSYVLIGNIKMSQLMDMAQSINTVR